MLFKQPNTNYQLNSKYHMDIVKEVVLHFMNEDIVDKPFDYLCRLHGKRYSRTNHKLLGIPGIFHKFEDTSGFRNDGRPVFMDGVHSMFPDGVTLTRKAAENIEYITKPLKYRKVVKIADYNIEVIVTLKVFCGNTVVTNVPPKDPNKVWIVERMALVFNYVVYDKQRVYETLNRLSEKDYYNNVMSEMDFLFCKRTLCKRHYRKIFQIIRNNRRNK